MNNTKTIKELERDLENFKLLSKTYNEKLKVLDKKNKLNAILFVGLYKQNNNYNFIINIKSI